MRTMNAEEKRWQRESDAHTLAEAEQIKVTPKRLQGAKKEAKVMAKDADVRAKAMKKVAGSPVKARPNTGPAKKAPVTHSNTRTSATIAKKRR